MIIRLRHNVIKTGRRAFGEPCRAGQAWGAASHSLLPAGVRMISLSYSRISLADIAQKLQLDSPEDAEFIVAKVPAQGVPLGIPTAPHPALFPCSPPCSTAGFGKTGDTEGTTSLLCVSPRGHPLPCPMPGLAGHPGRRHRGQHQPREGLRAVQGDD